MPPSRGRRRVDGGAEPEVDAVLAVQVGEDRRDLGAEHPQQRQLERLHHGHLGARPCAAAAATSSPIQPAPTITIAAARRSAAP